MDIKQMSYNSKSEKKPTHIKFKPPASNVARATWNRAVTTNRVDAMIDMLHVCLNHPLPRLLISVAGSGKEDDMLHSELQLVLRQGLRRTAECTNAWITTGGTKKGVMEYAGQAMTRTDWTDELSLNGTTSPVIGFAPFQVLAAKEKIDSLDNVDMTENEFYLNNPFEADAPELKPNKEDEPYFTGLDPNHDVFFFVDNGKAHGKHDSQYGTELDLRLEFEKRVVELDMWSTVGKLKHNVGRFSMREYNQNDNDLARSQRKNLLLSDRAIDCDTIFACTFVVQGGSVTLDIARRAIANKSPVVVCQGSGRCADMIAYVIVYVKLQPYAQCRTYSQPKLYSHHD